MNKNNLNKYRQTKEYFVPKVEYTYVSFKDKIIDLRKQYPNDAEFGLAVSNLLDDKTKLFPGVQNL